MSFKDLKEYLSDNHTPNRVIAKADGEYKPAPNFKELGEAVDVSKYDMPGDKHTPNGVFDPKAGGEYKPAPNYDKETAFGSSSNDSTAEELNKQDDRHAPNRVLKPSDTIDRAPNYDHETAFGDDGM